MPPQRALYAAHWLVELAVCRSFRFRIFFAFFLLPLPPARFLLPCPPFFFLGDIVEPEVALALLTLLAPFCALLLPLAAAAALQKAQL